MLLNLLILFTVVPVIELALLIQIGKVIDVGPTIGLILLTGIVGAARMPGKHLVDALMILIAGALLITPGVITDGIGFALLLPPIRAIVRRLLERRFRARFTIRHMRMHSNDDFIDVEAHPVDDDNRHDDQSLLS